LARLQHLSDRRRTLNPSCQHRIGAPVTSTITINDEAFGLEERDRAIESVWPYDGPHDRDSVVTAAASAAALIRYLNNATQPARSQRTLPYASTISDVLGSVRSTVMQDRKSTRL